MPLFRRSKVREYQAEKGGGIAGLLRTDSLMIRALLFITMSAVFFLFLKITERKIPSGLAPDTTGDTVQVSNPSHRTK